MADLLLRNVTVHVPGATLLSGVNALLTPGAITAIVGPNGAGKSTLLRAIAGIMPSQGDMLLGDVDLRSLKPLQRARHIAYLPQSHELAWDISVGDMVALGRFAYGGVPGRLSGEDQAAVQRAMEQTGCTALADRRVTSLSGGEQALACLARILAADTPVVLVDEPVAALDPANQYQVMECLAALAGAGKTVGLILHDLTLAAQFTNSLIWMKHRQIIAQTSAAPQEFARLTPATFARTPAFANDGSAAIYFRRGGGGNRGADDI